MLSCYRRDGVRDPAAGGFWTPASQDQIGGFELIQVFPVMKASAWIPARSASACNSPGGSRPEPGGSCRSQRMDARVIKLDARNCSFYRIQGSWALFSKTYCAAIVKSGARYRISIEGTPFTDLAGSGWSRPGRDQLDFSTVAALIRRPGGRTRLESDAGSVDVDDERHEVSGDFSETSLDQLEYLTEPPVVCWSATANTATAAATGPRRPAPTCWT